MVVFASPEWVHELDAVARRLSVPESDGTPPTALSVAYVLTDAPPGAGSYAIEFTAEGVSATSSPVEPPSAGVARVTITQPYDLAHAVADGRVAASAAVLDGRIRISGTVTELVAWQGTMQALDAALEVLRDRTTGPADSAP